MFPGVFTGRPSASSGAAAMDAVQASSAAARHGGANAQIDPALDIAALMLRRAVEPHPSPGLAIGYCGTPIAALLLLRAVAALVPPPPPPGLAMRSSTESGVTEPPYWIRTCSGPDPSQIILHHVSFITHEASPSPRTGHAPARAQPLQPLQPQGTKLVKDAGSDGIRDTYSAVRLVGHGCR